MDKVVVNCVVGIDPGANGGIAVFASGRNPQVVKMPKDLKKLGEYLEYLSETQRPIVFLEKLSVRPDDISSEGGRANMGKLYRIQKLIANYEQLKALIEVAGIPYVMVHPMTWQTTLKLRVRGQKEEKGDRKKRYQQRAAELYPGLKATLWSSDAILLMHFGRFVLANKLSWVKANLPEREHGNLFESVKGVK